MAHHEHAMPLSQDSRSGVPPRCDVVAMPVVAAIQSAATQSAATQNAASQSAAAESASAAVLQDAADHVTLHEDAVLTGCGLSMLWLACGM